MNPRIRDVSIVVMWSLIVTVVLVAVFAEIFLISGKSEILFSMINTTAEGKISEITFSSGGPVAIWVISLVLVLLIFIKLPSKAQKTSRLNLHFQNDDPYAPAGRDQFRMAHCTYEVSSISEENKEPKPGRSTVEVDKISGPYIHINSHGVEDPMYRVTLEYDNRQWFSDSFNPEIGEVEMKGGRSTRV